MSDMTPERQFKAATIRMLRSDPFYATLLMNQELVWDRPDVPTLATNGEQLFVNGAFFASLSHPTQVDAIKHELLHNVLLHVNSQRFPTQIYRQAKRLNEAMDHIVNNMLDDEGSKIPPTWFCDPKYKGWTVEKVYRDLPDQDDDDDDGSSGGGGSSDQPGGLGNDVMPSQNPDKATAKAQRDIAQATAVAKAQGKLPGKLVRDMVFEVLNPVVPWEHTLADWMNSPSRNDYSLSRPNRRFIARGLRLPGMYSPTGTMRELAVVLDISCSISFEERKRYLTEVMNAAESCEPSLLHVALVDTQVQAQRTMTPPLSTEDLAFLNQRGGGTDMVAGLDWAADLGPDVEGVIVMTDGHTPFGRDRGMRTLWMITDKNQRAPWGHTVHVD